MDTAELVEKKFTTAQQQVKKNTPKYQQSAKNSAEVLRSDNQNYVIMKSHDGLFKKELLMRNSFIFIIAVLLSNTSIALEVFDLTQSPKIQRELGLKGYKALLTMNFIDNGNPTTSTSLYKGTKVGSEHDFYQVGVGKNGDGSEIIIVFMLPAANCQTQVPVTRSFHINDTPVELFGACQVSHDGNSMWGFTAVNPAGKSYVHNLFNNEKPVHFKHDRIIVPFDTKGFKEAYQAIHNSL